MAGPATQWPGFHDASGLPHARVAGCRFAVGACLTLAEPIDFDAPDGDRVDILFVLLVPEDCNDRHLEILSELASLLSEHAMRDRLRQADEASEVIELLQGSEGQSTRGVG